MINASKADEQRKGWGEKGDRRKGGDQRPPPKPPQIWCESGGRRNGLGGSHREEAKKKQQLVVRWPRTRTDLRTLIKRGKSETPSSSVSTEDSRNLSDVRSDETQSAYDADEVIVNLGQIAGFHQIAVGTGEDFFVLGPRPGMQTSETFLFVSSRMEGRGKLLCRRDCSKDAASINKSPIWLENVGTSAFLFVSGGNGKGLLLFCQ